MTQIADNQAFLMAYHRLGVLNLAQRLDNVQEACRLSGTTRTTFYYWKKRYEEFGIQGLVNRPPIHKTHPKKKTEAEERRVVALALENPDFGANRLSDCLTDRGHTIANDTVQDILARNGMGTRLERIRLLEADCRGSYAELSATQVTLIEQTNPTFRERLWESSRPGERIAHDIIHLGAVPGIGLVYMHAVVDTFGAFAFALLYRDRKPQWPVEVLYEHVLPFYCVRNLEVGTIVTDKASEFAGSQKTMYQVYLANHEIAHYSPPGRRPPQNGFIDAFRIAFMTEFLHIDRQGREFDSLSALQVALDIWLENYNRNRPILGYRNYGKTPWEMLCSIV